MRVAGSCSTRAPRPVMLHDEAVVSGCMTLRYIVRAAGVVTLGVTAAAGAQVPTTPGAVSGTPTPPTDDIVVNGLRDLDLNDPEAPVTHRTMGTNRTGYSANASNGIFAMSERFARCAVTPELNATPATRDALRRALDGPINGAGQRFWQGRFVGLRSTCAQDPQLARLHGLAAIDGKHYDPSYYDRGAMYLRALQIFAPGLTMTRAQTADPIVQRRFDAREIPLARYRLPVDRRYFEIAVCLVRMQPELSLRLVRTQRADLIGKLEASIVGGGLVCVGRAKKVYFDPAQFRMYVADAVYRWAVAIKGTDSLVPAP